MGISAPSNGMKDFPKREREKVLKTPKFLEGAYWTYETYLSYMLICDMIQACLRKGAAQKTA